MTHDMRIETSICDMCGENRGLTETEVRASMRMGDAAWKYETSDDPTHPTFTPEITIEVKVWASKLSATDKTTRYGDLCSVCMTLMIQRLQKQILANTAPGQREFL